ncbi:YitT family protein [Clostridium sp. YIM B02505]|uniref:YitT family protein n=1 Tax=Clostridium yunnanense TaxID=2800325 RepID=A0ABS1ELT6_9CLOT|nr:YitT family protein [Clostridium yunnanense]
MLKQKLKEFLVITIGFILVSIAVQYFYVPNNISGGGITGIAMVINYYIPALPMGILMIIMNIVLFIIAFFVVGGGFGGKTLYAAFGLSVSMWVIEKFLKPHALTTDPMLAVIIGTCLLGIGLGVVFSQNASTGGTDILAKILNKFFHWDMGRCMQAVDIIVVILCAIAFGLNKGLYAIVCVMLNGIIIDKVIEGFNSVKSVAVFTNKSEIIKKYIIDEINRGCTVFTGKGGYTDADKEVIYCVMDRTQLIKLRFYIKIIDKDAFIIVSEAHEVLGQGFKDIHNG